MQSRWIGAATVTLILGYGLALRPRAFQPQIQNTLTVVEVASPASDSSAQPQLFAADGRALLSWIERSESRATLKFAERTDSGWSSPRVVATGDDWFVNWADVPSVIRLADGSLAAHWLQKSASSTYAYDVKLSFSKDEGRTWSQPVSPHHDGTPTEHGFASLFQSPHGAGLGLVWLDGRAMKTGTHDGHDTGSMSVRAAVFDTSARQMSETLVDDRVCECCPTAVAVTSEGPVIAYRNRGADETRDIYVSRLVNGKWSEPKAVHDDGWRIQACPVNGPALSARGSDVALAWFTAKDDRGRAFVAFSRDAGKTFGEPVRLDDQGSLGRVDVELLRDGSAVATWIEIVDGRGEFRLRHVRRDGTRSRAVPAAAISTTRSSGYPRMASVGNELLFAWTDTISGGSKVKTAVARLNGQGVD